MRFECTDMILAEKIVKLRKQQGWSQEELAAHLEVSRQSISKWESMASMPDLDKIIKLSQIFGVSTDYLLNEDAEDPAPGELSVDVDAAICSVSLDEANSYLDQVSNSAWKIAFGVAMCILCPVPLILLSALSEQPVSTLTKAMASGLGVGALLVLIAAAVAIFILEGLHLEKYEHWEKDLIETEYGVAGITERKREAYEPHWHRSLVLGVTCCILAVVPLILAAGFFQEENEMLIVLMIVLLLSFVAAGTFLLVRSGMIWDSFQVLLEEGDYTREKKQRSRKNHPVTVIYWSITTALYLGWSFATLSWTRTWIIWPVAGVLYFAIEEISNCIQDRKGC